MFTKEMFGFLFKVITSWQIIVVTVVLVIYFSLVSYVARLYHRPRRMDFSFSTKQKKEKLQTVQLPETSADDDLGL